ncbi:MAG: bifunctional DNA-formamidopyrimidine glycosylase/DNA-(apurinic or apyrimidinic site) lyase [Candidatus Firestonebacteria bacterium]|nr:bifunctional DNA-formamidopyrimidine glycosylase/DNA-(apurinic or apyrimidinic site) lyase [Candidatus Firestonebacteria bacterium]
MPELPEVETIRRVLAEKITGHRIVSVSVHHPKPLGKQSVAELKAGLIHQKIQGVERRAKFLLVRLETGALLVHLGMTGQLFARTRGQKNPPGLPTLPDKHTHLVLELDRQAIVFFRDIRRFGRFRWLAPERVAPYLAHLGPEPLLPEFTVEGFRKALVGRTASIKALLLNQKIVAGLGNIYVDEALFRAGIAPQTKGGKLTTKQNLRLHGAIREVLREAIRFRGTTLSDYFDPESRRGGFQDRLKVYGREGEPCVTCGTPISKGVLAQRGTHWCGKCQPVVRK